MSPWLLVPYQGWEVPVVLSWRQGYSVSKLAWCVRYSKTVTWMWWLYRRSQTQCVQAPICCLPCGRFDSSGNVTLFPQCPASCLSGLLHYSVHRYRCCTCMCMHTRGDVWFSTQALCCMCMWKVSEVNTLSHRPYVPFFFLSFFLSFSFFISGFIAIVLSLLSFCFFLSFFLSYFLSPSLPPSLPSFLTS